MDRCPHCGRKTISASRKLLCYNIFNIYRLLDTILIRFSGGRCPECNKKFIPSLPMLPMFIAGLILVILQCVLASAVFNYIIPIYLLLIFTAPFLPWLLLGVVGLFFPCVKYEKLQRKIVKPQTNGIVELKSKVKIQKLKIYGFRIYDEQHTDSSKKVFDDDVIPVRFIRRHVFENRWFVEIFNKDFVPEELLKDKTDFVFLENDKKVGNATYRRVDSY